MQEDIILHAGCKILHFYYRAGFNAASFACGRALDVERVACESCIAYPLEVGLSLPSSRQAWVNLRLFGRSVHLKRLFGR